MYGKGRKGRVLPLRGPVLAELRLFLSTDLTHVGRSPEPDDLNTTFGIYGHPDQTDLENAMDAYANWLEQQREYEIVPPEADH